MNSKIIKDMDRLEKTQEGYYDKELDMFFDSLEIWLDFKWSATWSQVL